MSDLISRQSVYDMLHGLGGCDASDEWSNGWDKAIDTAIGELNEIPTAYDVDKVIEQLEDYGKYKGLLWITDNPANCDNYVPVREVKKIVKGAVKDE